MAAAEAGGGGAIVQFRSAENELMFRFQAPRIAMFLLIPCIGCGGSRSNAPSAWQFVDTNGRLFVIEHGGSYGTERSALTTDDLGESWRAFEAPKRTCHLADNGKSLFAVTSEGGLWQKRNAEARWTPFGERGGPSEYLYEVLACEDGRLIVTSPHEITLYSSNGRIEHRFRIPATPGSERAIFARSRFATEDERLVLAEANPFQVFVLDLTRREITPWNQGLETKSPAGFHGLSRVRRHGTRFLVGHHDGIYIADGLLEPWRLLIEENEEGLTLHSFCRDLVSHDVSADQWLRADGHGIHLMESDRQIRTVFDDTPDAHDLIVGITRHRDHYFVSFARLEDRYIGVRISGDLTSWNALILQGR